jgi:hypothetical protein
VDFDIDCPADNPVFPGRVQSRPHLLYAVLPNEKASIRQLLDWLEDHHYSVIAKPGRSSDAGKAPGKVDFAVDLAVEALRIAPRIDYVVLVASDNRYRANRCRTAAHGPPRQRDFDEDAASAYEDLRRQADHLSISAI